MATAKKVVKKVKEVVKKVVKKKSSPQKVEVHVPKACEHCSGKGLIDSSTLCSACCGSGVN